ncbi:2-amino-4-hydroxy-6-hydroxymethyldihydropteridine diphosphokinase [Treponema sp.]|uniref:2-amino-4-hydroxy-6- hydroxymethyldihydropteridine diphosphokinase n=1 Tax=Treponema sp. TaxID=166 RepID=UPI00298E2439|nr:2-amino-4-hydroxy-6-hydroxymethyldihydropteridine diphosphokinase [Treponema sp.]MCR5613603.1 2-amino-4-hydroxy-6-hydroxymethyldihydropteridine diphosphokinase [Treponema sp.]
MNCVVLGLGSNKSYNGCDPVTLLRQAVGMLQKKDAHLKCSSVYRTKPMYVEDQEYFYNLVVYTQLPDECTPESLLQDIHKIENFLGRDRTREIRFGPRAMDIDIEFFADQEMNTPDLQIPHPRLHERAFVLQPLLEILTEYADVKKGEKLKKIQAEFSALKSEDVELYMSVRDFLLLSANNEVQNGNTDTGSSKDWNKNLSGR